MATSQNKMQLTDQDVFSFLGTIPDERKRSDSERLITMMGEVTGEPPRMWGSSIIGFGAYHYKYASGREGDAPAAGFSPRKQNISIYLMEGFEDQKELAKLGPHKTSKVCLYIKRLDDVDETILRDLIKQSYDYILNLYPPEGK